MNIKNCLFIFSLFIVLLCSVSVISAVSSDSMDNLASDMVSNDEFISVSSGEQADNVDRSVLSAQKESNNLSINNDENSLGVTNKETNMYLEDIRTSTSDEYYDFVNYLITQKGFKFNTKSTDDGYTIYSTSNYQTKLYDNENYVLPAGNSYFISKNRIGYVIEEYYPDVLYSQSNNIYLDELYLGWLKWVEDYHPSLNIGGTNTAISVSVLRSSSQSISQSLPSSFDLRNVDGNNYLTPVKNQANEGNCWAFASISALESFLLKSENKTYDFSTKYDFSENNLKNVMSSLGRQGVEFLVNSGGRAGMALAYFLRWSGPISEELDKYEVDSNGFCVNNVPVEYNNSEKHVQGIKYINKRNNASDNNEIKQAIMEYGCVVTSMWMVNAYPYLSGSNYYYYGNFNEIDANGNKIDFGHQICIVGWDDNYPKEKFGKTAPTNGAFIVRNSWGSDWGDNGYFYISYHDNSLAYTENIEINYATGFVFTSVQDSINYDMNYHYTPLGTTYWWNISQNSVKYRNQWIASSNEVLKACGIYVDGVVTCDIEVFVNDDDKVSEQKNILLNYAGFHTIAFENPIKLTKNQNFRIEVTLNSTNYINLPLEVAVSFENGVFFTKASSNFGESSFYNYTSRKWVNIPFTNANLCLNAYTDFDFPIPTKIDSSDLTMNYGENKCITATLYDVKDNKLKNCGINICINGGTVVLPTNEDGQVSVAFSMCVGTYNVFISYSGNEKYRNSSKSITMTVNQITVQVNSPSGSELAVDLPVSSSNSLLTTSKVTILTISGISSQSYGYKASCKLKLSQNKDLKVDLKVGSKVYLFKFNKGAGTLKFSDYNLKKGNSYKFIFSGGDSKYEVKKLTVTIKAK